MEHKNDREHRRNRSDEVDLSHVSRLGSSFSSDVSYFISSSTVVKSAISNMSFLFDFLSFFTHLCCRATLFYYYTETENLSWFF